MKARRVLLVCALTFMMLLASMPVAEAQRACADALSRCQVSCNQTFGSSFLGSIMAAGCTDGCVIGYVWCASGN